jgi:hypothetical protein
MTTLPIRRRDMVLGKYLSCCALVASVALYLVLFAARGPRGSSGFRRSTFFRAAMGLVASSVYTGVTLPLANRLAPFHPVRGAVAFILVFALSGMDPEGALYAARAGLTKGRSAPVFTRARLALKRRVVFCRKRGVAGRTCEARYHIRWPN